MISTLLLAACGGGGNGGPPAAGTPQTDAVAITDTNAKPLAANAISTVQSTAFAESASLVTGVEVQAGSSSPANSFLVIAAAARTAAGALTGSAPGLAAGVVVSKTTACDQGGTLSVTGNTASEERLVAGDNFTLNANNCKMFVDGATVTVNGRTALAIVSGSLDGSMPFRVVMTAATTNLSVQSGSSIVATSGDIRIDLAVTSATLQTLVASGASVTTRVTTGATTRTSTLKDYTQTLTVNGPNTSSSLSGTVETDSPRLGTGLSTYTVTTPTAVVWNSSSRLVTAGAVKVVGAAGSQLLVTASGANSFSLQVDANGDGTFEKTMSSTLDELETLF